MPDELVEPLPDVPEAPELPAVPEVPEVSLPDGVLLALHIASLFIGTTYHDPQVSLFNVTYAFVPLYLALLASMLPYPASLRSGVAAWLFFATETTLFALPYFGEAPAREGLLPTMMLVWVGYPSMLALVIGMARRHDRMLQTYAAKVRAAKQAGNRVVAVGSTSTRALEWIARQKGEVAGDQGIARLYLRPGDRFRVVDALITNFHLPGSTPLILVAAFAGLDLVLRAYREAIQQKYRFYSYGDAMLIL